MICGNNLTAIKQNNKLLIHGGQVTNVIACSTIEVTGWRFSDMMMLEAQRHATCDMPEKQFWNQWSLQLKKTEIVCLQELTVTLKSTGENAPRYTN